MRRFWSDKEGNIAVLFALALIPVIGALGAAVDYGMANSYRTDMQKALDSTALALSKILPADQSTLDTVGMQYFLASLGPNNLDNIQLTITPGSGKVYLTATGDYTPKLANLFGATQFEIAAKSEAKWSVGKLEIALVLDNSGSMGSQGRMEALKTASHDLLDILQGAAKEPDDAKVAIIPFDSAVRVNYSCRGSADATCATVAPSWVRFDWWDDYVNNNNNCSIGGYSNRASCEAASTGSCQGAWGSSRSRCERNGGTWVTTNGVWTPTPRNHATKGWNGCLYDRDKDPNLNYDVLDTQPNMDIAGPVESKYPAKACDSDSMPWVQALNNNWGTSSSTDSTTLHGKVNLMQPSGWTNITVGLVWGWHALSISPIFTEGVAYGTQNYTKYIILMTDGDNTKNRFGDSESTMNSRTSSVCTNIKAQGIKIYTIRLIDGNATLLQNCATETSMYYEVQAASQLASVFQAIGSEIASLHLAK
jgi:Flp pilus assembly protein TadG